MPRKGKLDKDAVYGVIGIKGTHLLKKGRFRGFLRQHDCGVTDAAGLAGLGLITDVDHAGRVFPHPYNHKVRHAAVLFRQRRHLLFDALLKGGRYLFSVYKDHRSMHNSTGQWSDPKISLWISVETSLSLRASDTTK